MTLQIKIDLTDDELRKLAGLSRGLLRENPRKTWTTPEYKEHARHAVRQIVAAALCANR